MGFPGILVKSLKPVLRAALAVAAIAVAAWLAYSWSLRSGIAELRAHSATDLEMYSAALLAPNNKYSYLPDVVSSHPAVIDALRARDDPHRIAAANTFLQRVNASSKAEVIYILDTKGIVIAASNFQESVSFVGHSYAFRPYFQDAMAGRRGQFYGIGATSLLPGYYLSDAILFDGRIIGVAVVKVDLSHLDRRWSDSQKKITVLDENGVAFLSSDAEWKYRPIRPLTPAALEQLKRTRQYDRVLKDPLGLTVVKQLSPHEQIIRFEQAPAGAGPRKDGRYFVRSGALTDSNWTINIYLPMQHVDAEAMRSAFLAVCLLAFSALSFLSVRQRMQSRLALEKAHQALEKQHRELQKLGQELRTSSITDPLTGAYNRRFFMEAVEKLLGAAKRHELPLSIVLIDFDRFKFINDTYGHPAGDKVLQAFTATCKQALREQDIFARFGGEEFIIALPHTDAAAAGILAERLRKMVEAHAVDIGDQALHLTVTLGVSQYQASEESIADTIGRADQALYEGKHNGRNRVVMR